MLTIIQRRQLDIVIGGGNVVFCPSSGPCNAATPSNLLMPNGLVRGADGLIYVPVSAGFGIHVYELQEDHKLRQVEFINVGMPMDNLATDSNGDIWAAGLPKALRMIPAVKNPFDKQSPSTVLRVRKTAEGYETVKVLEDREMKVLNQVSTIAHDVKTGRLFMGGVSPPFFFRSSFNSVD